MKKRFEFMSGIVLILASALSMILIATKQIGGCVLVGGSVLGNIVAYAIAAVLAVLGIAYIIQSRR